MGDVKGAASRTGTNRWHVSAKSGTGVEGGEEELAGRRRPVVVCTGTNQSTARGAKDVDHREEEEKKMWTSHFSGWWWEEIPPCG